MQEDSLPYAPVSVRTDEPSPDLRRVLRVTLLSAGASACISACEFLLHRFTGSLALKADALHTASDVLVSFLVVANCTFLKGRDRRFERGSGLLIAGIILTAAGTVCLEAMQPPRMEPGNLGYAVAVMPVVIALTYLLAQYKTRVGREEGFVLLSSEGRHTMADVLSSATVLVGLIGQEIGIRLDGPAAVVVGVLMAATGIEVAREHLCGFERASRIPLFAGLRRRAGPVLILMVSLYLFSGIHRVTVGEVAVVERFGRVSRVVGPGLHYRLPEPFERLETVDVSGLRRVGLGFRRGSVSNQLQETKTPDSNTTPPSAATATASKDPTHVFLEGLSSPADDEEILPSESFRAVASRRDWIPVPEESIYFTGDQNLVDAKFAVFYRVTEPQAFLYRAEAIQTLLKAFAQAAAVSALGGSSLDTFLGPERESLLDAMRDDANEELRLLHLGVEVAFFSCLEAAPPAEVVPAFRMVSSAKEDRERYVNEARAGAARVAGQGRADAFEAVHDARCYAESETARAEAEAVRLQQLMAVAAEAESGVKTNLRLEALRECLKDHPKLFVAVDQGPIYLDLREKGGGRQ